MDASRHAGPVEATLGPRIARIVADTRHRLGWSQQKLGKLAHVSQPQVSRIERGVRGHGRIDEAARLLDALGIRVEIQVRPPVLIGAPAQRDAAHARVVACTVRHLGLAGITVAREVPIGADHVRGWIDILGSDTARDTRFVVECKGDLDDIGALERQVSWYEREAPWAGRRLGWPPHRHQVVIVTMLPTNHNAELVRSNQDLLRERFPLPIARLKSLLNGKDPAAGPLRALAFVDPGRRGPGWLIPTPLEPGRPVVPYVNARAFLEGRRRG